MSRRGSRVRGSAVVFKSHGHHKTSHKTTTTRRTTVTRTTK